MNKAPEPEMPVPFKVKPLPEPDTTVWPFKSKAAPEATLTVPVPPQGVVEPSLSRPALMVALPVKVLSPPKVQVPAPSLVKVPVVVPKIEARVPPWAPPKVSP